MRNTLRLIALLTLVTITSWSTTAQQDELRTIDIITTQGGSIWKGTITEITEDRYYIVETVSGLSMRMHESAIKTVKQEWIGKVHKRPKAYSFKETGFYNTIEVGINGNSTGPGMNLTYSAGHRFNKYIGVGGGIGIAGYELGWGRNTVPLFAEARGFLTSKKVAPYYALRFGYGFALNSQFNGVTEAKGGYFLNPQIGVRFGGGSAVSFYTGLGVNFQKATYTESWAFGEQNVVQEYVFQRLEFKFGITF